MSERDIRDTGTGVTDRVQAGAQQLGESVEQSAARTAEHGKARLSEQLDRRTSEVGSQARSLATALRRSSEQLASDRGESGATRLSVGIADQLDRTGAYLEQRRGSELLDDAEQFARRRPWLVAGAAAAAGLMASRLLKASSDRRYVRSSSGTPQRRPETSGAKDMPPAEREAALASGV